MTNLLPAPSADEMAALRDGAAWRDGARNRLELAGPDRVRFLQNLVTCDVRELAPGRAARGFLTHVKGGVVADADVIALDDRFRLVLPAGRGEAVAAHFAKYRIVERVEIAPRPDLAGIELRGRRSPELLDALGVPEPGPGERHELRLGGVAAAIRGRPRGPRFELGFAAADRDAVVAALTQAGERLDLAEISSAAAELARIEDGELLWGVDYGEESFPQETGEESAVSYTKGCYLGQEVVARIHYRGGVQRCARRLRFGAGERPPRGVELTLGGRPVGRATSLAVEPASGRVLALALVHRRAEPGATLAWEAGAATVEEIG
jgi:folate-binding protein YgfZ